MRGPKVNDDLSVNSSMKRLKAKKSGARVRKPPKHETEPCVSEAHLRGVLEYISDCIRDWRACYVVEKPVCIEDLFKGDREAIRIFGILCRSTQRRKIFLEAGLKTHGTKRGRYRMIALPKDADLTKEHVEAMLALVRSGSAVPEDTDSTSECSFPGSPGGAATGRRTLAGLPLVRRCEVSNKRRRLSDDEDDPSGDRVGTPTGSDVSDEDFYFKQSATSLAEIESGAEALRNLRIFGASEHPNQEPEDGPGDLAEAMKQQGASAAADGDAAPPVGDDASGAKLAGAEVSNADAARQGLAKTHKRTPSTSTAKAALPTFSLDLGLKKPKKDKPRKAERVKTSSFTAFSQVASGSSSTSTIPSPSLSVEPEVSPAVSPPRRQNSFDEHMYGGVAKSVVLEDPVLRHRSFSRYDRSAVPGRDHSKGDAQQLGFARGELGDELYAEQAGSAGLVLQERSSSIAELQEAERWADYAKGTWADAQKYRLLPVQEPLAQSLGRGASLDMGRSMVAQRDVFNAKAFVETGPHAKSFGSVDHVMSRELSLPTGRASPETSSARVSGLSSSMSAGMPLHLGPSPLRMTFANGMRGGRGFHGLGEARDGQSLLATYGNWK